MGLSLSQLPTDKRTRPPPQIVCWLRGFSQCPIRRWSAPGVPVNVLCFCWTSQNIAHLYLSWRATETNTQRGQKQHPRCFSVSLSLDLLGTHIICAVKLSKPPTSPRARQRNRMYGNLRNQRSHLKVFLGHATTNNSKREYLVREDVPFRANHIFPFWKKAGRNKAEEAHVWKSDYTATFKFNPSKNDLDNTSCQLEKHLSNSRVSCSLLGNLRILFACYYASDIFQKNFSR